MNKIILLFYEKYSKKLIYNVEEKTKGLRRVYMDRKISPPLSFHCGSNQYPARFGKG